MKFQDQWIAAAKANGYQGDPSTPRKIALMKEWEREKAPVETPSPAIPAPKKRGRKPK